MIILPFVRKPSQLGHHGNKCQDVDPEQEITVHDAKIIRNSLPQLTASAQIIVGEMADDADGKSTHGDDVLMNFAKYRRNFTWWTRPAACNSVERANASPWKIPPQWSNILSRVNYEEAVEKYRVKKSKKFVNLSLSYLEQPRESTLLNGFKLKHVIERQILLMKTKPVSVQRSEEINSLESLSEAMDKPWSGSVNSAVACKVVETKRRGKLCKDVKKVNTGAQFWWCKNIGENLKNCKLRKITEIPWKRYLLGSFLLTFGKVSNIRINKWFSEENIWGENYSTFHYFSKASKINTPPHPTKYIKPSAE